jgi:hypothetical protein
MNLYQVAMQTAQEMQKTDSRSAKWIATDAIRDLTGDTVQRKLSQHKG